MHAGQIAVRALVAYLYLLVMARMSGKRVVAEATTFDFIVALIVGDMVDDALWAEVSIAKFAVGAGSIFVVDAIMKIAAFHSEFVFRIVNGLPVVVMRDGVEDKAALRGQQMNEGDLAHLTRLRRINEWEELALGVIERDAELSVLYTPQAEPARREDADRVKASIA